jgi:hypothetical protein
MFSNVFFDEGKLVLCTQCFYNQFAPPNPKTSLHCLQYENPKCPIYIWQFLVYIWTIMFLMQNAGCSAVNDEGSDGHMTMLDIFCC